MKQIKFLLIGCVVLLTSCNSTKTKAIKDASSMTELGSLLETEFGSDAYYTKITFVGSDTGVITNATVTKDPASLKMGSWSNSNGTWKQSEEITLEVSGVKASDFMFQINKKVNFKLFGELVEKSINKVVTEKGIKDVKVDIAYVKAPSDGDFEKMTYNINIKPKNGGTTFMLSYKLDGTLDSFDY